MSNQNENKNTKLIIFEWISVITVFLICFVYLANKMEKQTERTDRLYEMFIGLLSDKKIGHISDKELEKFDKKKEV